MLLGHRWGVGRSARVVRTTPEGEAEPGYPYLLKAQTPLILGDSEPRLAKIPICRMATPGRPVCRMAVQIVQSADWSTSLQIGRQSAHWCYKKSDLLGPMRNGGDRRRSSHPPPPPRPPPHSRLSACPRRRRLLRELYHRPRRPDSEARRALPHERRGGRVGPAAHAADGC